MPEHIKTYGANAPKKGRKPSMGRLEIAAIILGNLIAADKTYDWTDEQFIDRSLKMADQLIAKAKKVE